MPRGLLIMSANEVERIAVIKQIAEKQLKQRKAAVLLSLSTRQIIRLVKLYRREGPVGLVSKQRGRVGNRQHKREFKEQIKELVLQHYYDFGATFAAEKLREQHQLEINKETLRQWMIEWEAWKAKRHKNAKIHQSRARRDCFGELIQIDGSPHDWFEGRRAKCCLLVFIDDATSRLVGLRFEESETTVGYFRLARDYIQNYGRPLALYSDKDSIFRVNLPEKEEVETQFARAMRELGIELICANSPQAKGRVERANGTLQKRLTKELRLRKINTIEEANAYLPEFIQDYNRRFAVEAKSAIDVHRKNLPDNKMLNLIFSFQHVRKLSKNLETTYNNVIYQVKPKGIGYGLRHAAIKVCEDLFSVVTLLHKGSELAYVRQEKQRRSPEIIAAKQLDKKLEQVKKQMKKYVPGKDHPWRYYVINPAKHNGYKNIKVTSVEQSYNAMTPSAN
jgi:hypothetical protein